MNRILLTTLASAAICFALTPRVIAAAASPDAPEASHHHSHHGHAHHETKHAEKSDEEMVKECEDHFAKIKDAGASLLPEMKAEFDYHLDLAAVEIKALKDPNHKDHRKHYVSGLKDLNGAEHILKKHENQMKHAKAAEERKAKADERKARAEERKAKAEARKAERDAAKAKREADKAARKHDKKAHEKSSDGAKPLAEEKDLVKAQENDIAKEEKSGDMDHGRSEGGDTRSPGSLAAKATT